MATETTGPFSAVHGPLAQPARHAVVLGYQVVDRRAELAIHVENLSQGLLKCGKTSDWFCSRRPMNKAICRPIRRESPGFSYRRYGQVIRSRPLRESGVVSDIILRERVDNG